MLGMQDSTENQPYTEQTPSLNITITITIRESFILLVANRFDLIVLT